MTTKTRAKKRRFVIHEHHATRLHFDLRLEVDGVGKSWAVPKGPSMDPFDKRLAVAVPDHSLSYFKFEGSLADGTYGAGEVRIWDAGYFETDDDPKRQLDDGKLSFTFLGQKVRGGFVLIRLNRQIRNWLLIKVDDVFADVEWRLKTVLPPKGK